MSAATAWAVFHKGTETISVASLAHTRRGAMVNWLVTEALIPVRNHWSDARVEAQFAKFISCEAVEVEIRRKGEWR